MHDTLRPHLDDDDSKETPISKKRKNVGGFLSGWRAVLDEDPHAERLDDKEEDDDEESLEGGRYSRFKRYFRRLFKENVEKPQHFETEDRTGEQASAPNFLPSGFVLPRPELGGSPAPETAEEQTSESSSPRYEYEDTPPSAEAEQEPSDEVSPETNEQPPELPHEPEAAERPPEPPLPPEREVLEPDSPPPPSGGEGGGGTFSMPERVESEKKAEATVPPHKHSNLPAWLSFLGGEFLSRRRDRKLHKETVEVAKQQEQLRASVERDRANQLKTEKQRIADRERLANIEKRPPAVVEKPTIETTKTAAEDIPHPEGAPIQTPEMVSARELNPQRHKELSSHDTGEIKPQNVLEQVEVAAAKNIPIESLYERRHEVKDEDRLVKSASQNLYALGEDTAKPVADILAGPEFTQAQRIARLQDTSPKTDTPVAYNQAVKMGLLAGLVVIGLVVLAILFR